MSAFLMTIVGIVVLTIMSLLASYVLFNVLSSWAEGKSELFGGTIKYGGAIAIFLLVFSALLFGFSQISHIVPAFRTEDEFTDIYLSGNWKMISYVDKTAEKIGFATIEQESGSRFFTMTGTIENSKFNASNPDVTFTTLAAQISDRRFYLIYENSDNESGVGQADIVTIPVTEFSFVFRDLIDRNFDGITSGQIRFVKEM